MIAKNAKITKNSIKKNFNLQTGKQQQYELGKWLRRRYSVLLNSSYATNTIYVQSTDVDRTIMSAESNLAGLFPPKRKEMWNPEVLWQPIPVHIVPENMDSVLSARKPCPAYDEELYSVIKSEEFKRVDEQFKDLYEYLSEHAGQLVETLYDIESIHSTLTIELIYNKT